LLDCCQIPLNPEQHKDGRSFYSTLLKQPTSQLKPYPIYWHYPHYNSNGAHPASAIIDDSWKLIHWHEDNQMELYNLVQDEGEQNNIIAQFPNIKEKLWIELQQWRQDVHAQMPVPNPEYYLYFAKTFINQLGKLVQETSDTLMVYLNRYENSLEIMKIPFEDIIEEWLDKEILFKLDSNVIAGKFFLNSENILIFSAFHEEKNYQMGEFLKNYIDKQIAILAWDNFEPSILGNSKKLMPQITILHATTNLN
jgi:hypothetical protein